LPGEVEYLKVVLEIPNTPHPKASSAYRHLLSLGLKVLRLGRTLYLWGRILDCLPRTANLSQDATFPEPKLGIFAL
jgi:hypothetical protein